MNGSADSVAFFHLDALPSAVGLSVDVHALLTIIASLGPPTTGESAAALAHNRFDPGRRADTVVAWLERSLPQ